MLSITKRIFEFTRSQLTQLRSRNKSLKLNHPATASSSFLYFLAGKLTAERKRMSKKARVLLIHRAASSDSFAKLAWLRDFYTSPSRLSGKDGNILHINILHKGLLAVNLCGCVFRNSTQELGTHLELFVLMLNYFRFPCMSMYVCSSSDHV